MSWLRALIWLFVAAGGMVVIFLSYREAYDREGGVRPRFVLFVAEKPQAQLSSGTPVAVGFLAPAGDVAQWAGILGRNHSSLEHSILYNHQEKVILLPDFAKHFTRKMLASGRLPAPGAEEVLAESSHHPPEKITAGREVLQVVGVLKREDSPGLNAFYAPKDPALQRRLAAGISPLKEGFLVPREEAKKILAPGGKFPRDQFVEVTKIQRLARGPFQLYLAGLALLLFGGSALLIQAYCSAARHVANTWLGPPLAELRRRWKLLMMLHVAYFGLYFAGALVIYEFPLVQSGLLTLVGQEVTDGSGPLGVAGQAYASRIIPLAAVVTLAVNFFVGSLLYITVPSLIIPGLGILPSLFRAVLWGILLAPAFLTLAGLMRLHSMTLLLEGEGYILASFFAVLVPVWLFSPQAGKGIAARYGHALVMNLKGNLLVLIVLTLAALYEAIEVILQMK